MIELNEFYIDKKRGHPVVITIRVNTDRIAYQIYRDEYLEPQVYKCKPHNFKDTYVKLDESDL